MKLEKAANDKRNELVSNVTRTLQSQKSSEISSKEINKIANLIIDKYVTITPPEKKEYLMKLIITRDSGKRSSISRKPGNLKFNLKKLIRLGATAVVGVAGVTNPIIILVTGLILWNDFWSLTKIEISERHSTVIWTMWNNRDKNSNNIEEEKIYPLLQIELEKHNLPTIEKSELTVLLKDLERMGCIERNKDKNMWWLREWVKIPY